MSTVKALFVARLFGRTAGLIWTTSPAACALLLATVAVSGLAPVARLWIAKLIIDGLVAALSGSGGNLVQLLPLVALEFLTVAVAAALQPLREGAQLVLAHRLRARLGEVVMRVAMGLDYAVLEDPRLHDRLQRAQVEAGYRPLNLLIQLSFAVTGLVGLVGLLAVLTQLHVLAPLVLILFGLPYVYVQSRGARMAFWTIMTQSPDARRLSYLATLTAQLDAAKETRLFGLSAYLLQAYREVAQRLLREMRRVALFQGVAGAAAGVVGTVGYFGAYAYVIAEVLARRLTVGDLTIYAGAFFQAGGQVQGIAAGLAAITENGLFLRDLFEFLDLEQAETPPAGPVAAPVRLVEPPAIVFEDVSFRYPGQEVAALKNVTLPLPPGRVVALVGENGAGKTTLIKLLCGLYQPTSGRILLDGRDTRELAPEELRARLGVLFQDFVHYQLTVRENIGFGDVRHVGDLARIEAAARRAGADEAIGALPNGYQSQLGKVFDGGVELSGGEWQRLALARAYMRDAPVLVLDEPTANLDPKAEQRVFEEVRSLLAGRMAIIISHRFSTVRLADEIYVLHQGAVVEHGSHEQLMALGGRYAELYELQAAAYR